MQTTKDHSFIVLGPPRVGKSTLINAFCGENVATVGGGFSKVTKKLEEHVLNIQQKDGSTHRIRFFDLPGIESWVPEKMEQLIDNIFQQTTPIAAFVVLSNGCYANPPGLVKLSQILVARKLAIAFVLSNMHAGSVEQADQTWEQVLALAGYVGTKLLMREDELCLWSNCLAVQVNASPYESSWGKNRVYPIKNVDKLIVSLFCLLGEEHKLQGLALAVKANQNAVLSEYSSDKLQTAVQKAKAWFASIF